MHVSEFMRRNWQPINLSKFAANFDIFQGIPLRPETTLPLILKSNSTSLSGPSSLPSGKISK